MFYQMFDMLIIWMGEEGGGFKMDENCNFM